MLRRALASKEFTLMRLQHALQNLSTLRGFGVGDSDAGDFEALLRVEFGVLVVDAQCGLRDEAEAAPFEVGTQLENFRHGFEGGAIAFPGNYALVLIFDFGLACLQLAQKHNYRLQHVERLEAGDYDGLVLVVRDPFIRAAADDGGDVAGADESVEAHVRGIKNRTDGGDDGDVVAENRKVADTFGARAHDGERGGGRGGFEADGEKHYVLFG